MDFRSLPGPRPWPLLGNLPQLRIAAGPVQSLMALARQYGPVFRMTLRPYSPLVFSKAELVAELCDETRFEKFVGKPLQMLRRLAGSGLFTADNNAPEWHRAHRILTPAFAGHAVRSYFPVMLQAARALRERWMRLAKERQSVDVTADMTRLTFDTIGLAGFNYDFASLHNEKPHPFIESMTRSLSQAMQTLRNPLLILRIDRRWRLRKDLARMKDTVDSVIQERRKSKDAGRDLLGLMLEGRDPEDGSALSDVEIRYQILTFLVAGHETTSGLLSFALFYILRDPDLQKRLRAEIDRVIGPREPDYEDLANLTLIGQCLDEALRLWPPAPIFARAPRADVTLANGLTLPKGQPCLILLPMLHRDPEVWADAEGFDPSRFEIEKVRERNPGAYKPWGTGRRICIGRAFALAEARLALAMILRDFELDEAAPGDLSKAIEVSESLTLKPARFTLIPRPRLN